MKSKVMSVLKVVKRKAGPVLLCGALIVTMGAGTVLADNTDLPTLIRVENGVTTYSTDGGKTWSEKAPEEVTVGCEKGKSVTNPGNSSSEGEGRGLLVKMENGVTTYSTDGGKTWSEKASKGVTFSGKEGECGKCIVSRGTAHRDGEGKGVLVKMENGERSCSVDGGKTWDKEALQEFVEKEFAEKMTLREEGSAEYRFVR